MVRSRFLMLVLAVTSLVVVLAGCQVLVFVAPVPPAGSLGPATNEIVITNTTRDTFVLRVVVHNCHELDGMQVHFGVGTVMARTEVRTAVPLCGDGDNEGVLHILYKGYTDMGVDTFAPDEARWFRFFLAGGGSPETAPGTAIVFDVFGQYCFPTFDDCWDAVSFTADWPNVTPVAPAT